MFQDYKDGVIAVLKKYDLQSHVTKYNEDDAEQAWHEHRQEILECDTIDQAKAIFSRLAGFPVSLLLYPREIEELFTLYLKWRKEMESRFG